MKRFRSMIIVVGLAGAVVAGAAAAQASPPVETESTPDFPEICLEHHSEWSDADWQAMWELMQSHDVGAMGGFHGGAGSMASIMGGAAGHMGWGS